MTRARFARWRQGERERRPVDASAPYEVGYGKPPTHSQFKKGQSGNPAGRPKQRRNFKTILAEVLQEPVQIRQGERARTVPYTEALIRSMASRALQGDAKFTAEVITLIRLSEGAAEESNRQPAQELTAADEKLIANFLERHGTESSAGSPNVASPKRGKA